MNSGLDASIFHNGSEGAAKTKFGIDSPWVVGGLFLVVWVTLLVPISSVTYLPLVDLPNHLARQYIGANIDASQHLSNFYDFEWRLIPYIFGDALSVGLIKVLSSYDAGRFILGLSLALWLAASMLLHKALWGRFAVWPLFSAFVLYNGNVAWGFQNYFLSSALSVIAFTLWVSWNPKNSAGKTGAFLLISTFVYFSHLFAFALLGLLVLSYEGGAAYRQAERRFSAIWRRLLIVGIPFLGGILHSVFTILSSPPRLSLASGYSGLTHHLNVLFSTTLSGPDLHFYFGGTFDLFVFLTILIVLFFGLRKQRWFELHPTMVCVVAALGFVAYAIPAQIAGIAYTHYRLPFVLVVLLTASSRWNVPSEARRWGCVVFFGVMLALRVFVIEGHWRAHDLEVAELIRGLGKMEKGARLLPVFNGGVAGDPHHWHSASYAVIERDAYIPGLFTGVTLLKVTPPFRRIDAPNGIQIPLAVLSGPEEGGELRPLVGLPLDWQVWRRWRQDYTHVLVFDRGDPVNPFPDLLVPISTGSYFVLYRNVGFGSPSEAITKSDSETGQK